MRWRGYADSEATGARPCIRRGSSCSLTQGVVRTAGDVPVPARRRRREPRPSSMQRLDHRGGLCGRESRDYRSPEAGSRGSEGAVGLARHFRGYRDPDMTFHAWAGVKQHSVARVSIVGTAPSTAVGNPRPILSRIAWGRCDFRLVGHFDVPCCRAADVAGVVESVSWV